MLHGRPVTQAIVYSEDQSGGTPLVDQGVQLPGCGAGNRADDTCQILTCFEAMLDEKYRVSLGDTIDSQYAG